MTAPGATFIKAEWSPCPAELPSHVSSSSYPAPFIQSTSRSEKASRLSLLPPLCVRAVGQEQGWVSLGRAVFASNVTLGSSAAALTSRLGTLRGPCLCHG